MSKAMMAMIHDDITWCIEEHCPMIGCMRNQANMYDRTGLHSYAAFRGTQECPISSNLGDCLDGCLHAKESFASHDDPNEALTALMDEHCEDCVFSSVEED